MIAQTSLSSFTSKKPVPCRTSEFQGIVRSLGLSKVKEPKPAERSLTWQSDEDMAQRFTSRESLDTELNECESNDE